jgi:hypothetical protein
MAVRNLRLEAKAAGGLVGKLGRSDPVLEVPPSSNSLQPVTQMLGALFFFFKTVPGFNPNPECIPYASTQQQQFVDDEHPRVKVRGMVK